MLRTTIFLIIVLIFSLAKISYACDNGCIKVTADVDNPVVFTGHSKDVVVKVGLTAPAAMRQQYRVPLNVAVVLDKSGSMNSQDKIQNAKRSAIEIVERLDERDILSVVVYDSYAQVLIPAQGVQNKTQLIALIDQISANGSTAMYAGINLGTQQLRRHASSEYLNRIILLSDGLANVGPQSVGELSHLAQMLQQQGFSISTVGVGLDYDEDMMTSLAYSGDGNTYFAKNSDVLPEIFANEINAATALMAQEIRVTLECGDDVVPLSFIGREGEIMRQTMTARIPYLYEKNEKYVLFELNVPPQKEKTRLPVARALIEYSDPLTQELVQEERQLYVQYSADPREVELAQNKRIVKDTAIIRTAQIEEQAVKLADQGAYQQSQYVLEQRADQLEKVAKQCDNDKDLWRAAEKVKGIAQDIMHNMGLTRYQRKFMKGDAQTTIGNQYEPYYIDSTNLLKKK